VSASNRKKHYKISCVKTPGGELREWTQYATLKVIASSITILRERKVSVIT
jgi:hypothetical protein